MPRHSPMALPMQWLTEDVAPVTCLLSPVRPTFLPSRTADLVTLQSCNLPICIVDEIPKISHSCDHVSCLDSVSASFDVIQCDREMVQPSQEGLWPHRGALNCSRSRDRSRGQELEATQERVIHSPVSSLHTSTLASLWSSQAGDWQPAGYIPIGPPW